ncbi:unnamed protein product [Discosporangium mesarthrocarpum]
MPSTKFRRWDVSISTVQLITCLFFISPYWCLGLDHALDILSPLVTEFSPTDEKWTLSINERGGLAANESTKDEYMPPRWDSTKCLERWNMSHLMREVDPNGYYFVTHSREQLGGVMPVLADAMFMARSLNRTLVELPVSQAMVKGASDWTYGINAYWDMDTLCVR